MLFLLNIEYECLKGGENENEEIYIRYGTKILIIIKNCCALLIDGVNWLACICCK